MLDLAIVVPTFNERGNVAAVVAGALPHVIVTPAQAGVHRSTRAEASAPAAPWIPAFAGMTEEENRRARRISSEGA